jgi:hypothetical protein
MPNWCNNSVELYHEDPAMIERARSAFGRGEFLQEFIPCPKELLETTAQFGGNDQEKANFEKFGYHSWYDFNVNTWGTKWDIGGDAPPQDIPGGLMLNFDSAWAPPCAAYDKLLEQGFKIRAMYYEPGMAFAGVWEDGSDDCYEYGGMNSQQIAEELPVELNEAFGISEQVAEWEEENEESEDE